MKKPIYILVLVAITFVGCTNYHIEQNSRNGTTSCDDKDSKGVVLNVCNIKK